MISRTLQIEQIDAQTILTHFEGIKSALNAIQGKISPLPTIVFLTPDEVAARLKVSKVSIWSWTKQGILKSYRIGNQVRYIESEVIQSAKATGRTNGQKGEVQA